MASGSSDSNDPRTGGQAVRFVSAVVAPLAVTGLAYVLWWISDRLGYIGPLDRAAFGWVVVLPVWLCAPVAAGVAWRRLTAGATMVAAILVGVVVSSVAAILFWQSVAHPDCEFPIRAPIDWVLPSVLVGVAIGLGPVLSGLLAVRFVRTNHPWRGAVLGAAADLGLLFMAIIAFAFVVVASGASCSRTPI